MWPFAWQRDRGLSQDQPVSKEVACWHCSLGDFCASELLIYERVRYQVFGGVFRLSADLVRECSGGCSLALVSGNATETPHLAESWATAAAPWPGCGVQGTLLRRQVICVAQRLLLRAFRLPLRPLLRGCPQPGRAGTSELCFKGTL